MFAIASYRMSRLLPLALVFSLLPGCATTQQQRQPQDQRVTKRDKTKKGAAIGAASGAVLGAVLGEGELDKILAGAAIGAGVGAGIGVYMDRQEERLSRIPGTTVERISDDMILVHFESDLLFAVDSSSLSVDSRASLDAAAQVFLDQPKTAIIAQGHTDSTGSEEHNLALSERRAKAVSNYLVGRGIDATRITALGYGEAYPVADNATDDGRMLNRRVDLLLKAKRK
jgi:outer membrane protein OmpA-like peptidoglycan-associated protein